MIIPDDVAACFADTFAKPDLTRDLADHLSCTEAEALAAMLTALGAHDAADRWFILHAESDDHADLHPT
jgi:hypothetical protein